MMLYQCDICGEKDIIENADFVHIGDAVLCKLCYRKIVKSEAIDEVLEIIDEVKSDTNNGYMFDMVDEIKNRVLALKGE